MWLSKPSQPSLIGTVTRSLCCPCMSENPYPQVIRVVTSTSLLKSSLKTFLFSLPMIVCFYNISIPNVLPTKNVLASITTQCIGGLTKIYFSESQTVTQFRWRSVHSQGHKFLRSFLLTGHSFCVSAGYQKRGRVAMGNRKVTLCSFILRYKWQPCYLASC